MLVVTRKPAETVLICSIDCGKLKLVGVIAIVESRNGRVRFGMNFPPEWKIYRTEITNFADLEYEQILNLPIGTEVTVKERER